MLLNLIVYKAARSQFHEVVVKTWLQKMMERVGTKERFHI